MSIKTNRLYPTISADGQKRKAVFRWDPAGPCSERCVVWEECPYREKAKEKGLCKLEKVYLNRVYRNMMVVNDMLSDFDLQRIGMHLMPLYQQLIRLKKVAFAVENDLIEHDRKSGRSYIHPVFKEIREVLKEIGKELKDLQLEKKWQMKFGDQIKGVGIEELMEKGDPGYYEKIAGGK